MDIIKLRLSGYSILELLIIVTIIIVTINFCFYPLTRIKEVNDINNTVHQLEIIIHLAQQLALSENLTLKLYPLDLNNWANGIKLINNANKIIQQWQIANQVHISWKGFGSDKFLIFSPSLQSNIINGHFFIKTSYYCKKMILNRFGQIHTTFCS